MLKKTLLTLAAVAAVLIVGFFIVVVMQPNEFHIERSATMAAPPEAVFVQVNDFHNWEAWSPWLEVDPAAKSTFEGPSAGDGAIFRWAGNAEVGEGSMTIVESKPHELVRINLHFVKPFEDTALTEFTLKPDGDKTAVTWSMDGKNNFMSKAICLFMDMDEMIGGKYEQGLAKMKTIVENPPAQAPSESTTAQPADKPAEQDASVPGTVH